MSRRASTIVTLLTDFGNHDPYVGLMKGAIHRVRSDLGAAGRLELVDLTHEIPRHRVEVASFWLEKSMLTFPAGTIHTVVVDPGVGTERRSLIVAVEGQFVVCPDNGLVSDLASVETFFSEASVWKLDRSALGDSVARRGTTFDGRDLYAPTAALLSAGCSPDALGARLDPQSVVRLDVCSPPNRARVRVIDQYGNLITDVPTSGQESPSVLFQGRPVPYRTSYAEGRDGELCALRGSFGTLEMAVNQGSAAAMTGAEVGSLFPLQR